MQSLNSAHPSRPPKYSYPYPLDAQAHLKKYNAKITQKPVSHAFSYNKSVVITASLR